MTFLSKQLLANVSVLCWKILVNEEYVHRILVLG